MIIMILFLIALIAGCGDQLSTSDDSSGTAGEGSVLASGQGTLDECIGCHSDSANPAGLNIVVGDSDSAKAAGQGWLNGPHGNYEFAPNYLGMPPYAPWLSDSCLVCHDSESDGLTIGEYAESTGRTAAGEVDRPVVGCTACHGSGDEHFGIGDVEFIAPGPERCGACHNEDFPHVDSHSKPAGDRIYEDFVNSPHARSNNAYIADSNGLQAACGKCHTDEGARLYKNDPYYTLFGQYYPESEYNDVQCRTCHDAHNPSKLLKEAGTDSYGNAASSLYMSCTNCHMDKGMIHGVESAFSWGPQGYPSVAGVGNFDSSEIIYDTHIDWDTTEGIEGYILDPSNPDVCIECHNVHSADISINEQWARSAHGGHMLDIKERAFLNVSDADPALAKLNAYNILNGTDKYGAQGSDSSDEFSTPAFTSYDFKSAFGGSCLRCKTSTGYREFASDPVNFNSFATMSKFYATGTQKELIYCWACHTSSAGALRDPLDVAGVSFVNVIESQYAEPAGRIANVPDIGGSNICMSCHSARGSGADILASFTNATIGGNDFGSFTLHYLGAGGTLFRLTGFEFRPDSDYDNYSWYAHDRIGVDIPDTGENGPCVGCHMRSDESHSYEVTINDGTYITNILTYDQTCSVCHGGEDLLISSLNEKKGGFINALAVLNSVLASSGGLDYDPDAYPYIFPAGSSHIYPNRYTAWSDIKLLGVAINLDMLKHEPGAYAHNSLYTKRLLFDSIDFLEDGASPPDGVIALSFIGNASAYQYLNNGSRP
jgi:hypothetical protein